MDGIVVRITKSLSFEDIQQGKIEPIQAYQIQVESWILKPAKYLAKLKNEDTDHGMALLALELMFFEPHGQYLTGEDSDRQSKPIFCKAFAKFRDFLITERLGLEDDLKKLNPDAFYKFARCGLFHSAKLANELLVDAVNSKKFCLSRNTLLNYQYLNDNNWLVNPWLMLDALEKYLRDYVSLVQNDPNGELAINFNKTFDRLIREPMDYFLRKKD